MTTSEFAQFILEVKKETAAQQAIDETAACETAQLISGSITYPLYEALWVGDFDMDAATRHLVNLYDSNNYHGFIYFIFILANAVDMLIPYQFAEMSANDTMAQILSAAIIEDWLEYDIASEATEYE